MATLTSKTHPKHPHSGASFVSFQRISLRAAAFVVATGAFEFTLNSPPWTPPVLSVLLPCDVGRDPNRSTFEPKQPPLELRRVPPLPASWRAHGSPLPSGSASCCLLQAEHADHGRRCGSFGRSTHRSINGGSHRCLPRRMNGHRPPTGPEKLRAPCCTSPRDRGNTGVTQGGRSAAATAHRAEPGRTQDNAVRKTGATNLA